MLDSNRILKTTHVSNAFSPVNNPIDDQLTVHFGKAIDSTKLVIRDYALIMGDIFSETIHNINSGSVGIEIEFVSNDKLNAPPIALWYYDGDYYLITFTTKIHSILPDKHLHYYTLYASSIYQLIDEEEVALLNMIGAKNIDKFTLLNNGFQSFKKL